MKTSNEGFQQCYNAQVTVDAEHQLVVATDLTANASDQGELPVLLDAVKETFAAQPETVLADAGYCNERDLTDLEKRGIDGYVALGREGKQTATRDRKAHPATARMTRKHTMFSPTPISAGPRSKVSACIAPMPSDQGGPSTRRPEPGGSALAGPDPAWKARGCWTAIPTCEEAGLPRSRPRASRRPVRCAIARSVSRRGAAAFVRSMSACRMRRCAPLADPLASDCVQRREPEQSAMY